MARAVQRPAARRDFIVHYVYLAENAGLDVAKRFREAVESTYANWRRCPGLVLRQKCANGNIRIFAFGVSTNSRSISLPINLAGAVWASSE